MNDPLNLTVWTLEDALPVIRKVEEALFFQKAHVALAGSVLTRGSSDKDLDLLIYPHSRAVPVILPLIKQALKTLGFKGFVAANRGDYKDDKLVWICSWNYKRVDVFVVL